MADSRVSRTGTPAASRDTIREMEAVAAAKSDVNNVAVFTKFIKKAEDTAQAAL